MCPVANLHICNVFHKRWHLPSSPIPFALCSRVSGKIDFSKACNIVTDTAHSGNAHNCRFHGLYFWLLEFALPSSCSHCSIQGNTTHAVLHCTARWDSLQVITSPLCSKYNSMHCDMGCEANVITPCENLQCNAMQCNRWRGSMHSDTRWQLCHCEIRQFAGDQCCE